MKRQRLAIDIDECLAPYLDLFSVFYNEHWRGCRGVEKVSTDISEEDTQKLVNAFHSSELYLSQKAYKDSIPVMKRLKEKYDLVVVTSRSYEVEKQTRELIDKWYPDIFESIEFGNAYGMNDRKKRGKGEICLEMKCEVLIDDSPKYCNQVIKSGMKSILFGNYPWNDEKIFHIEKGVVRVSNWEEVEKQIEILLAKK